MKKEGFKIQLPENQKWLCSSYSQIEIHIKLKFSNVGLNFCRPELKPYNLNHAHLFDRNMYIAQFWCRNVTNLVPRQSVSCGMSSDHHSHWLMMTSSPWFNWFGLKTYMSWDVIGGHRVFIRINFDRKLEWGHPRDNFVINIVIRSWFSLIDDDVVSLVQLVRIEGIHELWRRSMGKGI